MEYQYELNLEDGKAEARHVCRVGHYAETIDKNCRKVIKSKRIISASFVLVSLTILLLSGLVGGISGLSSRPITSVVQIVILFFFGRMFVRSVRPGALEQLKDTLMSKSGIDCQDHRMLGWRSVRLSAEHLELNSEYVDEIIRPGAVDQIDESEEYFFLLLANGFVLTLPKRDQTDSTLDRLREMLGAWSGKEIRVIPA